MFSSIRDGISLDDWLVNMSYLYINVLWNVKEFLKLKCFLHIFLLFWRIWAKLDIFSNLSVSQKNKIIIGELKSNFCALYWSQSASLPSALERKGSLAFSSTLSENIRTWKVYKNTFLGDTRFTVIRTLVKFADMPCMLKMHPSL